MRLPLCRRHCESQRILSKRGTRRFDRKERGLTVEPTTDSLSFLYRTENQTESSITHASLATTGPPTNTPEYIINHEDVANSGIISGYRYFSNNSYERETNASGDAPSSTQIKEKISRAYSFYETVSRIIFSLRDRITVTTSVVRYCSTRRQQPGRAFFFSVPTRPELLFTICPRYLEAERSWERLRKNTEKTSKTRTHFAPCEYSS